MSDGWVCPAYGADGVEYGALCFFAESGQRVCSSREACDGALTAERQRVYGRIQELAAGGDEVGVFLAAEFGSPEELLGGPASERHADE